MTDWCCAPHAPGPGSPVGGSDRGAARSLQQQHRWSRHREDQPGQHVRSHLDPAKWPVNDPAQRPVSVVSDPCRRVCAGLQQLHRRQRPGSAVAGCARRGRAASQFPIPRAAILPVGDGTGALRLFAKTGLVIRPGTEFELIVPARITSRLSIGWGNPGTPRHRVVVNNCPNPGGGWLACAGGFWIDHPACVPIIVRAGSRQQRVRIGVGRACPGQRPPQGPSQGWP